MFPYLLHPGVRVPYLLGQHPARRCELPPEAFHVLRAVLPGIGVRPAPHGQGTPRALHKTRLALALPFKLLALIPRFSNKTPCFLDKNCSEMWCIILSPSHECILCVILLFSSTFSCLLFLSLSTFSSIIIVLRNYLQILL